MILESFLLLISSLRNQFIYFAIAISLPSMFLYLAQVWTILRHKEFHNSFYSLVVVRSIPNLLYTLNSYYCYRLTILFGNFLYPIYQSLPNWLLRMSYFLTFFTMLADYLATILILLNRWTAVKMPLKHKKIWKKCLPFAIGLVFGVPLILYGQEFTVPAFNQLDGEDNSTRSFYILQDLNPIYDSYPIHVTLSCAFMLISIGINISTFRAFRRHQNQHMASKNATQRHRERVENKLLTYALLTFLGHAIMAANQILIFWVVSMNDTAMVGAIYTQYPWTMDLGSVVLPSWLLFWASDSFRERMKADFVPKWLVSQNSNEVLPVVHVLPASGLATMMDHLKMSTSGSRER